MDERLIPLLQNDPGANAFYHLFAAGTINYQEMLVELALYLFTTKEDLQAEILKLYQSRTNPIIIRQKELTMALPGEAREVEECDECGMKLPVQVLRSSAGYYIGQWCSNCGPYSRLSKYYRERLGAEAALKRGDYDR